MDVWFVQLEFDGMTLRAHSGDSDVRRAGHVWRALGADLKVTARKAPLAVSFRGYTPPEFIIEVTFSRQVQGLEDVRNDDRFLNAPVEVQWCSPESFAKGEASNLWLLRGIVRTCGADMHTLTFKAVDEARGHPRSVD